jgi:hypothetical protein
MDRRHFIIAAGLSTVPLVSVPLASTDADTMASLDSVAVVDRRFAGSALFARAARRHGASVHLIDGDLTPLILERRLHRPSGELPALLVGLTTAHSLFCIEMLHARPDFRVVHRIEHGSGEDAVAAGRQAARAAFAYRPRTARALSGQRASLPAFGPDARWEALSWTMTYVQRKGQS